MYAEARGGYRKNIFLITYKCLIHCAMASYLQVLRKNNEKMLPKSFANSKKGYTFAIANGKQPKQLKGV